VEGLLAIFKIIVEEEGVVNPAVDADGCAREVGLERRGNRVGVARAQQYFALLLALTRAHGGAIYFWYV
jgi:hypothetical protein